MRKKEDPNRKDTEDQIKILSKSVELSNDAIVTTTLDGIITSWNRGAELIYGFSAKEALGMSIDILDPPALIGETKELNELIEFEEQINNYETLRIKKDNTTINVSLTLSPILDDSENIIAVLIISRDTTKSKSAEKKLEKSEELYRIATEQTGQVIYNYNLITDKCSWVGAIEEVTGYSFEEFQVLGKFVWITRIFSLEGSGILKSFERRNLGDRFCEELRFKRKDGTFIYIENSGVWLKDDYGRPLEAIGVIKNITDWKIAVDKVEKSEEKYHSLVQNFHGIVFQYDENFFPIFLDGAVEDITGYKEDYLLAQIGLREIIHPGDLSLVLKEEEKIRNLSSSCYTNIEYRIKRADGSTRWINEFFQKIYQESKPSIYQGTLYDVTERKETEKFLENIEIARKKEIHHRIKNNLQVISSLLDLQAEQFRNKECIRDSEVLEAFRESQNRVISMALIHEELYKGGRFETLDFSPYIKELVEKIFQTYNFGEKEISLKLDLEENTYLDMDVAIPLGMIVNELVTNSFKHAFPDKKVGEIQVGLHREEKVECNKSTNENCSNTFTLTVSDNGVGVPKALDIKDVETLGMQLVFTLVDQLDGEFELKRNSGTEFDIRFTIKENNDQILFPVQLQLVDND